MARERVIAEKTVKMHVSSVLAKLGLADRTQAAPLRRPRGPRRALKNARTSPARPTTPRRSPACDGDASAARNTQPNLHPVCGATDGRRARVP
ncbi:MAG: LuxR C-terminal-related transcriptional regulator [Egibacteraceae bacterium]